jgi:hypothetical protein
MPSEARGNRNVIFSFQPDAVVDFFTVPAGPVTVAVTFSDPDAPANVESNGPRTHEVSSGQLVLALPADSPFQVSVAETVIFPGGLQPLVATPQAQVTKSLPPGLQEAAGVTLPFVSANAGLAFSIVTAPIASAALAVAAASGLKRARSLIGDICHPLPVDAA